MPIWTKPQQEYLDNMNKKIDQMNQKIDDNHKEIKSDINKILEHLKIQ